MAAHVLGPDPGIECGHDGECSWFPKPIPTSGFALFDERSRALITAEFERSPNRNYAEAFGERFLLRKVKSAFVRAENPCLEPEPVANDPATFIVLSNEKTVHVHAARGTHPLPVDGVCRGTSALE